MFRSPLENVLCVFRPFIGDQKPRLALIMGRAEIASQIADRFRSVKQILGSLP
jgi:hypothetical protein